MSLPVNILVNATFETIVMVITAGSIAGFCGALLALLLYLTRSSGLSPHPVVYQTVNFIMNMVRSIPFIILLILLIPVTRFLVGSSIGTLAAIVPLAVAATPFVGRMLLGVLLEIPRSLIEMGQVLGATRAQMIWKIILPEALPGIIHALTVTFVQLVGYSAMAGAVGAGGLGNLAINYGYQRYDMPVLFITVIILICLVQALQWIGDYFSKRK